MVFIPRVTRQAGQSAQFQGQSVTPVQDQTGRQLQQVGRALNIAGAGVQQMQDRIDETAVKQADTIAATDIANLLSGEGGYLHQVQGQAVDGFQGFSEKLDEIRGRVSGQLTDHQRAKFDDVISSRVARASTKAAAHLEHQTREQSYGASVGRYKASSLAYQEADGDERQIEMGRMKDELAHQAQMRGWSADQAKAYSAEQLTAVHAATLDSMVGAGDVAGAREYLSDNEKGMSVAVRERARSIIGKAEVGDRAQGLLLKHGDKSLMDVIELSDKEHAAGNISDKVRAEWVRRAENRTLVTRRETSISEATALQQAQEWAASGQDLTPELAQALEDTDQQWKFDAWSDAGGAWKTTEWGTRQYLTTSDSELAQFKDASEVFNHYRAEMDDRRLEGMVNRWKGVQIALGKAAASSDDVLKINREKQLRVLYRKRLGGDPDAEKGDFDEADFERWSFDLEMRAQAIIKDKGVGETEALNLANDQMEALPTVQGKSFFGMKPSEQSGAQVQTSLGVLDLNLIDDTRLEAARKKLVADNNSLIAAGKPPVPLTPPGLYEQAHADLLAENKQSQLDVAGLKQRGVAILRDRFRMMQSDPAVQREIRRNFDTFKGVDVFGRKTENVYPRSDNFLGQQYSPRERLMLMFNERHGESLSSQFGLSPNEIGEVLQVMSGTFADKRKGRGQPQPGQEGAALPVVEPDPLNHQFNLGGGGL